MRIIDVSDLTVAVEIGHFLPERGNIDARAVDVVGSLAFLAVGKPGFSIIEVSDPGNPIEVGYYDTPRSARSISVFGSLAFVGESRWLRVFDISVPSEPREIDSYKMPASIRKVQLEDSKVYVAASEAGLMILESENRAN